MMSRNMEFPEGWKKVRLGEIAKNYKKIAPPGSKPYLEIGDIDIYSKLYNLKEKASPSHCLIANRDNIVISKVRPTRGAISKIKESILFVSPALLVLECDNFDYLFFSLSRNKFFNYLGTLETGTTYPSVNDQDILSYEILIPENPAEQQKIAEILETVDNAIGKTDKIIEKYKRIKQGLMQDLLTKGIDENWQIRNEKTHKFKDSPVGRIPEEWEVRKLGDKELGEIIMGQSPPSITYNKDGSGLPFFQGSADFGVIYPKSLVYTNKPLKVAIKDDILISVRAPVGAINLSPFKCCIGRGLAAIRLNPSQLNYLFISFYLRFSINRFLILAKGSTFEAIKKDELQSFSFPLPPLSEQQRIASILSQIDEVIEKEKAYKEKLERIKKGLMEDLLPGKVRVNKLLEIEEVKL